MTPLNPVSPKYAGVRIVRSVLQWGGFVLVFAVLAIDAIRQRRDVPTPVLALVCALIGLLVVPDQMLMVAMPALVAALIVRYLLRRRRLGGGLGVAQRHRPGGRPQGGPQRPRRADRPEQGPHAAGEKHARRRISS